MKQNMNRNSVAVNRKGIYLSLYAIHAIHQSNLMRAQIKKQAKKQALA